MEHPNISDATHIAVVGLGYVGLPVAASFGQRFDVTGFDIDQVRIAELQRGFDRTRELRSDELVSPRLQFTSDPTSLRAAHVYIVTVPTPIDREHRPDLSALRDASRVVGEALTPGAVVIYESTVYPGVTEDICGPILAEASGLRCGVDFTLGYSPERINPGDREHTFRRILKVVAGQDPATLERVASLYERVVEAGVYRAPSIRIAEAAKVIENTQRDLNIALMNELAIVFDRIGLDTHEVLAAAKTKWNFLPFVPGLVGGHCIGVDPYYLTSLAEQHGLHPEVILAGRRINDAMGRFVAQKTVKLLARAGVGIANARVAVLGLTFKEDLGDIRNSRVPDLIAELQEYGIAIEAWDPVADAKEVRKVFGFELTEPSMLADPDAVVLAVPHVGLAELATRLAARDRTRVLIDVKSAIAHGSVHGVEHWRL